MPEITPVEHSDYLQYFLDNNAPPPDYHLFLISGAISKGRDDMAAMDAKITLLMSAMEQTYQERSNLDILIQKQETALSSGDLGMAAPLDCAISCACVGQVVSRYRTSLANLDTRLDLIMTSLEQTSLERWSLVSQIRKLQGAHSPLRRLPTELLSLIFTFANIPSSDPIFYKPAPWNLSQVCAHWRAVAMAQHGLWSTVVVNSTSPSHTKIRLETQLQRAVPFPLNVTFILRKEHSNDANQRDMLEILARHSVRWQRFTLSCSTSLYPALSCIRNALPLLQELRIQIFTPEIDDEEAMSEVNDANATPQVDDDATSQVDDASGASQVDDETSDDDDTTSEVDDDATSPNALDDIFKFAPSLSAVYIDADAEVSFLLPASQLLRYRGTWDRFAVTFPSGSHLVECALTTDLIGDQFSETIFLPNLLCLSLCDPNVLEYLITPALQTLYWGPGDYSDFSVLLPFFERVPCKLQRLILCEIDSNSDEDFTALFRVMPTITYLGVNAVATDSITDLLCALFDADTVPHLASLALALPQNECVFDYSLLVDMLENRSSRRRLPAVDIWSSVYPPIEALDRMRPLGKHGLRVTLYDPDSIYYNSVKRSVFDVAMREELTAPHKRHLRYW
ncbi:hypothetical protein B0H11DRAFT_2189207 [Mycena galericulata]|nr:hypothetical protein B0H11DRAFT_2189207 [Mycena galericulata]